MDRRIRRGPFRTLVVALAAVAAVAAFLAAPGCYFDEDPSDVWGAIDPIIAQWNRTGLAACLERPDGPERDACLLRHRTARARAQWLRSRLADAFGSAVGDWWDSGIDALGETLRELAWSAPPNFGSPLGPDGELSLEILCLRSEGKYEVAGESSMVEVRLGRRGYRSGTPSGRITLELSPDGAGGFTGNLDDFELDGVTGPVRKVQDGAPAPVAIDASGRGTMGFRAFVDHSELPSSFPWWIELPVERLDPDTLRISTGGMVPAETIFPSMPLDDDCNGNGRPDDVDIRDGTSRDCDRDGIPDECEAAGDRDADGVPDACAIAEGMASDRNENGVPDDCEARIERAFAFNIYCEWCSWVSSDPSAGYMPVHAWREGDLADRLAYHPDRGWGYEVLRPRHRGSAASDPWPTPPAPTASTSTPARASTRAGSAPRASPRSVARRPPATPRRPAPRRGSRPRASSSGSTSRTAGTGSSPRSGTRRAPARTGSSSRTEGRAPLPASERATRSSSRTSTRPSTPSGRRSRRFRGRESTPRSASAGGTPGRETASGRTRPSCAWMPGASRRRALRRARPSRSRRAI
jgi:hypothetical protein